MPSTNTYPARPRTPYPDSSDLLDLPSILNLDSSREPRCIGHDPQGNRCTNRTSRVPANRFLDMATLALRAETSIHCILESLAAYVLCPMCQFHAVELVARWESEISRWVPLSLGEALVGGLSGDAEATEAETDIATGIEAQDQVEAEEDGDEDEDRTRSRSGSGSEHPDPEPAQTAQNNRCRSRQYRLYLLRLYNSMKDRTHHVVSDVSGFASALTRPRVRNPDVSASRPGSRDSNADDLTPAPSGAATTITAENPRQRPVEGECAICFGSLLEAPAGDYCGIGVARGRGLAWGGARARFAYPRFGLDDRWYDGEDELWDLWDCEEEGILLDNGVEGDVGGEDEREGEEGEKGEPELSWCKAQCGVNYHKSCIEEWLLVSETVSCPTCRSRWLFV
ncbi:hypothetical protein BDW62DRAFT_205704 [Aspergillus aurantiobrunneus]